MREDTVANETEDAAEKNSRGNEEGKALGHGARGAIFCGGCHEQRGTIIRSRTIRFNGLLEEMSISIAEGVANHEAEIQGAPLSQRRALDGLRICEERGDARTHGNARKAEVAAGRV